MTDSISVKIKYLLQQMTLLWYQFVDVCK